MIINGLTGCYIVFDTKNWNIKLDTLALYIIIAVLVLLNVLIIKLYIRLCKRLPPMDDDVDYYDENGNHIYYDRKLIAQLEKEQKN